MVISELLCRPNLHSKYSTVLGTWNTKITPGVPWASRPRSRLRVSGGFRGFEKPLLDFSEPEESVEDEVSNPRAGQSRKAEEWTTAESVLLAVVKELSSVRSFSPTNAL